MAIRGYDSRARENDEAMEGYTSFVATRLCLAIQLLGVTALRLFRFVTLAGVDTSFPLSFVTHRSDDERHGLKELAGLDLVTATSDGPKKGIDVSHAGHTSLDMSKLAFQVLTD